MLARAHSGLLPRALPETGRCKNRLRRNRIEVVGGHNPMPDLVEALNNFRPAILKNLSASRTYCVSGMFWRNA